MKTLYYAIISKEYNPKTTNYISYLISGHIITKNSLTDYSPNNNQLIVTWLGEKNIDGHYQKVKVKDLRILTHQDFLNVSNYLNQQRPTKQTKQKIKKKHKLVYQAKSYNKTIQLHHLQRNEEITRYNNKEYQDYCFLTNSYFKPIKTITINKDQYAHEYGEDTIKKSRSWKDQSKRRRQWGNPQKGYSQKAWGIEEITENDYFEDDIAA